MLVMVLDGTFRMFQTASPFSRVQINTEECMTYRFRLSSCSNKRFDRCPLFQRPRRLQQRRRPHEPPPQDERSVRSAHRQDGHQVGRLDRDRGHDSRPARARVPLDDDQRQVCRSTRFYVCTILLYSIAVNHVRYLFVNYTEMSSNYCTPTFNGITS